MQQVSKNIVNGSQSISIDDHKVAIKLKDGTILSLSDLPPSNTTRWVASAKASVIRVYMAGLAAREDLIKKYNLSQEEFDSWLSRYVNGGNKALKVINTRKFSN